MSIADNLGKKAELKIKEWLDRPEEGFCFDRIPDQMTGFYGSKNICDFTLYKYPEMYYIESKATYEKTFKFDMLTEHQFESLVSKSKIHHVHGAVIVLFASYKRAFWIPIQSIVELLERDKHSINIEKIDKWDFEYHEIKTIPNNRKDMLDYDKAQEFPFNGNE